MTITQALKRTALSGGALAIAGSVALSSGTAHALSTKTSANTSSTDQQHLQTIISRGDQEISRRLTTLNTLTGKINSATKLTSSDKTALGNEVSAEITGLTALKTKLDADTDLATARTDAQSIINEYRVYALVAPKVALIKIADDQQVTESKLTALAQKLQTRITADKNAGKDVTTLQNDLNDMTAKTTAAQGISSSIEQAVIGLQPTDYDSNHAVLSGDRTQLQTAHSDNQAAATDAKNIVAGL